MQQVLVTRLPHIAANRENQETGEPPHVYPKKKIVLLGTEMVSYLHKKWWKMFFDIGQINLELKAYLFSIQFYGQKNPLNNSTEN